MRVGPLFLPGVSTPTPRVMLEEVFTAAEAGRILGTSAGRFRELAPR